MLLLALLKAQPSCSEVGKLRLSESRALKTKFNVMLVDYARIRVAL